MRNSQHWHKKRLRAEQRFRWYGRSALALAIVILLVLLGNLIMRGYSGFLATEVRLPVTFAKVSADMPSSQYNPLAQAGMRQLFPAVQSRHDVHQLYDILSLHAGKAIHDQFANHPEWNGNTVELWVPVASHTDLLIKGRIASNLPEAERRISDAELNWIHELQAQGRVRTVFNTTLFSRSDSRAPEHAGFWGAMIGSVLTLLVCLLAAFPIGVMTAVYLEEFARKSALVSLIEVNINNLAAVPSIVFGLLGLSVYINLMGLPRSSSIVGGLTLALMSLPVIIIATRIALRSVPRSIRDAARALGASPIQVVWHHVLPLSMPGIMTGTILSMARAIGETAPLLMIGMVAFIADVPTRFSSPTTVMPVQIYLWSTSPEMGFGEKTAAGILVLLMILLAMNALAIVLRKKFEVRW